VSNSLSVGRPSRSIAQRARGDFDSQQVDLIRATVAKDANDAELAMFLELCRRYELDPFAGQIYCAKMPGKDGGGGRISIIVGRDGFLTIAERHPDFEGFDSDVVRAHDTYEVRRDEHGYPVVQHSYKGTQEDRGPVVGAWCIVFRTGRRPRYFYAAKEEYKPLSEAKLKYSPWSVQESVMMEKCAITTALRMAFNISGVVGEEEASRQLAGEIVEPDLSMEFTQDAWLNQRLVDLFAAANEMRRDSFRPKKQRLLTGGKTDGELRQVAAEIEAWITERDGVVPETAPVIEAEAEELAGGEEAVESEPLSPGEEATSGSATSSEVEKPEEGDPEALFGPMPGDGTEDIPFGDAA
jgi:phage recombination protein Bet